MRRGLLLAVCLLACHREKKQEVTYAPLDAEFAGCAGVVEGPVCELPNDRAIRIFVPGSVTATFSAPATELRTFPEGKLHRVVLPEGATSLTVEKEGKRFTLALAKPAYPWILEARAVRAKDPEAARTQAKAHLGSKDPTERALALGLIARLDLAKGDVEDAIARFRESIGLHTIRISDRAEDSFALAFALNQRSRRYEEARAVLDAIEPIAAKLPEARARLPYYRAEIALEIGDLRSALVAARDAQARTARIAITRDERNARSLHASVLQMLGRFDEAIQMLRGLDLELTQDPSARGCERAETLLNLGLSLRRRDEVSDSTVETAEFSAPAERALSLFPDACSDPNLRAIANELAASAAIVRKDFVSARASLAAARPPHARTTDVVRQLGIEARLAAAEGDLKNADAKWSTAIDMSKAAHQLDMLWRATIERARVRESQQDDRGALADATAAETLLDDLTISLPFDGARGEFLSHSEQSARLAIELLLRHHRDADAFLVARRARARVLISSARTAAVEGLDATSRRRWEDAIARFRTRRAQLDADAEGDWKLASAALVDARTKRAADIAALRATLDDAMSSLTGVPRAWSARAPEPGELWIGFHRTRTAQVSFAALGGEASTVQAATYVDDPLAPHAALLARAKRVVFLPYGALRSKDLHSLPAVAGLPVSYAIDVPSAAHPRGALVGIVADPTQDLAATHAEADALEKLYPSARVLRGTAATATAVLDLLRDVDVLHYAGHGVFGGPDGTESRLPLAAGSQLGVLDVLSAPRVPAFVVLSACESAKSADVGPESLGIAQAFALAGAQWVIAPSRAVRDDLARDLTVRVHRVLLQNKLAPDEALRVAQKATADADPVADVAAFRLLRP